MNNNNQNSSASIKRNVSPQSFPYPNEYDSNTYVQYQTSDQNLPFSQSQVARDPYHLSMNGQGQLNASHVIQGGGAIRAKSEASRFVSSQVKNEQVVKGQSRVSYVPYEKKVIQYENRTYVQKVPIKRKVTKYHQQKVVQTIPHEVVKQDYYAVEKRVEYIKQVVPEKRIEMVSVEKKIKRYEYVPVEKQIVHYPQGVDLETAKSQSRLVLKDQGVVIKADAQFKPIDSKLLYNYSNRPDSKYNPIGYVDQGTSRIFSTAPTFSPTMPVEYLTQQRFSNQPQSQQLFRSSSAQRMQTLKPFSPKLMHSGVTGHMLPGEGESYIKELNNLNGREMKRPFQMIEQKNGAEYYSNGQRVMSHYNDYGQNVVIQEDPNYPIQRYNNFNIDNMDWRIQR